MILRRFILRAGPLTIGLVGIMSSLAITAASVPDEIGNAVRQAIGRVSSSVVRIQIIGTPNQSGSIASRMTTGVVISDSGDIVTSSFGFNSEITAVFAEDSNGQRRTIEVVAQDHIRKLVLLKCDPTGLVPTVLTTEQPDVGAWSIAVGRFYRTQQPSAALGVVSAVNRVSGLAIQTDAKVSPVNYGGPLIGLDGRTFGILVPLAPGNDAIGVAAGVKWYDSGIGFAIPMTDVLESVKYLRGGQDRKHGVLGIQLTTANPLSQELLVKAVHPGSPAAVAGIEADDLILAVNGQAMSRVGHLQSVLNRSSAGSTLNLTIRREEERQISATLTDTLPPTERGWFGIVPLAPVADDDSGRAGVHVIIVPGSPAADAGLPESCVVTHIGDNPVSSALQLRTVLKSVEADTTWNIATHTANKEEGSDESQTYSVTSRSRDVSTLLERVDRVDEILRIDRAGDESGEWSPLISSIDDETQVWMLAPKKPVSAHELGIVILLHGAEPETELLSRDWREVCTQHHLVLAVLFNPYGVPVTDPNALMQVIGNLSKRGKIDPDRITIMADRLHAELASQLVFGDRTPVFRSGVFLQCRPAVQGMSLVNVQEKHPSVLIFSSGEDVQGRALLTTSAESLRDAGVDATIRKSSDDRPDDHVARQTARWLLMQKIR